MKSNSLLYIIGVLFIIVVMVSLFNQKSPTVKQHIAPQPNKQNTQTTLNTNKIVAGNFDNAKLKSDAEWKKILTATQYHILREQGTEIPFTGILENEKRKGIYYSVGCNEAVFSSEQKFDSGTGWPSFWAPIAQNAVVLREDTSLPGSPRIEVLDQCGGHLGHVFDDGPQPTGKRYCINSAALYFKPQ